ncbi:hypothetical protein SADUNF_Sadunf05G0116600 [Salix dunnii]|uniref:Putative plant transposon protein domain-containing protein n=1 Tax=Salix dunnii TaxID=1413687 RepID=A0A835K888_9ROSI|nr:hypothetical protein SADUNF_Sadunf05G0116600 [Salix dunnii]
MAPKKRLRRTESRSKQANDPTSSSGDNIQRFLSDFSNRAICVERGLGNDLSALGIDTLFAEMGWYSLYEYKKPTYPKLMRMFFANMRVNVEPRIISTLQGNPIEFNCAELADILGAKIKSQDLLLRPRLLHRIIAHNILPKKGHYDEVTFMELCLIDCMIQRRPINLPYIMIRNMILAYNQKQKALPYGQVFTTIFEHFDILLTGTDKKPYSDKTEIDTTTLTRMKYVLNENGEWIQGHQEGAHAEEEHVSAEEEENVAEDEFTNLFESPPPASSPDEPSVSGWSHRMESRLTHIEADMRHMRDSHEAFQTEMRTDMQELKEMMTSLLSRYPPP